jgi:hypothetical protein
MEIERPSIVETHGGRGKLYLNCYRSCGPGVVFETDEDKTEVLADQRPEWAVYQADCIAALAQGVGFQFRPNFFDLDPYGDCWPVVDAVFAGMPHRPDRVVFVVNDGLRRKLKMHGGWSSRSMAGMVQSRGNDHLYREYLDVCRELMREKAGQAGYDLTRWTGYYCGHAKVMIHFAAVLDLRQPVESGTP